jgi:hypothetical protein
MTGIYPFGETVQVLDGTATSRDGYNNDVPSYPVKATYTNVPVAPSDGNGTGGNEYTDGRETVVIGLSVYLPDGADVQAVDRVRVRGADWEVVGDPQAWQSPYSGWRPGTPVALRRVTG